MSRFRRLIAYVIAAALAPVSIAAQEAATVTGRVTNAQGQPEAAVLVRIPSLNAGISTGADGTYRLVVPGARLTGAQSVQITASRQGLSTGTATVTLSPGSTLTQNFTLSPATIMLEGMVVTALGISREERSVSTSMSEIEGSELTAVPQTNLVSALTGQASGVQVTSAGPQGGSARVVIRGANSLTGNNQPLFVVDGVPVDNAAPRLYGGMAASTNYSNLDYGNAAGDINPNDIESVTILKGPNAAALYGSRAANGAIIITTRSGQSRPAGLGITVSTSVTSESPLRLPRYQNQFGQGCEGFFEYVDGNYGGVCDGTDESWGPALDGRQMHQWFNAPGETSPWVPAPNNVRDFWENGLTQSYNVALTGSADRANMRVSLSHLNQDGMGPGFDLEQTTASLNGGANLSDRFRVNTSVQYISRDGRNRYGGGYEGDNAMLQFIWFGRQVDMPRLRQAYENNPGQMVGWNYSYHSNPYWISLENGNEDSRDRIIGNVSASYELTNWLSATASTGTDWYRDGRLRTWGGGTIGLAHVGQVGTFARDEIYNQIRNHNVLLTVDRDLSSQFSLNALAGAERRDETHNRSDVFVAELISPRLWTTANAALAPQATDFRSRRRVNSVLGQATLGFRDFLFLDATARNDWSSTLPSNNNSYFYPSLSGSFIFTDAFPTFLTSVLSYGKLRASWARVGNDAAPYQLAMTHTALNLFGSVPGYATGNLIPNPNLRPEETTAIELGTELRFLNDRAGIDLTWYDRTSRDQIVQVQVSPASGYTNQLVNAGVMTNSGLDIGLNLTPLRLSNGFEWDMRANYNRNRNRVESLPEGVQSLTLGTFWGVSVQARVGEPYGTLFGSTIARDSATGLPLLYDGYPEYSPGPAGVIGNYNPDWIGSLSNSFRFRNVSLNVLVDGRKGGDIFSVTNMFGLYTGVLEETAEGRCYFPDSGNPDAGMPSCAADGAGLTVRGVDRTTGEVMTWTGINPNYYWGGWYGIHEQHVLDGSFVKLREMTLGYAVPQSLTQRMGITGMNVALTGRNLWMWSRTKHIDPETSFDASNAQGFEFGQLPTARSVGFNISVTP
jgi:TonB-linked SusC/RagA family outer membrane protein